ncbi:MAG: GNAT family N-acetyltransferase [Alphaproteobacteria bacterium]|nr:GNAT family N-acetyltransferase [Alphaproteobacteria bacterium]
MRAEIVPIAPADKPALWAELQDYIAEMTAHVDIAPVNGAYEYPGLDAYWTDAGRCAFWAVAEGERAGFALLRRDGAMDGEGTMIMAEFYVRPRFRRTGLGLDFARRLLARFPATWILSEFVTNTGAIAFWRRAIEGHAYSERNYVGGQGKERIEQRVVITSPA